MSSASILMFKLMEPKNFFIPNAKMQDMFQPDSISMDFIYQDTVGNFVRIWMADILNEQFGFEEESLFIKIDNKLYAINLIENKVWLKLNDHDGYETLNVEFNPVIHTLIELMAEKLEELEYYNFEKSGVQYNLYIGQLILMLIATLSPLTTNITTVPPLWQFVKGSAGLDWDFKK